VLLSFWAEFEISHGKYLFICGFLLHIQMNGKFTDIGQLLHSSYLHITSPSK